MKRIHRGDDGFTDLINKRVPKDDPVIEFLGQLDELVAVIGVARSIICSRAKLRDIDAFLDEVQRKLMKIASAIAVGQRDGVSSEDVEGLEKEIERIWRELGESFRFIIPCGPIELTIMNLARAVCRRVERRAASLLRQGILGVDSFKYLNRLSDLLYTYMRYVDKVLSSDGETPNS